MNIQVCIVDYATPTVLLSKTITSVSSELTALQVQFSICIVDNGNRLDEITALLDGLGVDGVDVVSGHGNIGFGAGNNIAIGRSSADLVLILNPDVVIVPGALSHGVEYMSQYPNVVMTVPFVYGREGQQEYLCRTYPNLRALTARQFPSLVPKRWGHLYLQEQHDWSQVSEHFAVASGCFMLCRGETLRMLGGFDERFFLYFEDYDLTIRMKKVGRVVYLPDMKIHHAGGHTARKPLLHRILFVQSAARFYLKHGFRW